jgi:hypothetical protein
MWVPWTRIGASRLKKHSFNFLIKSLKAHLLLKGILNKEKPLINPFSFLESVV